MTTSEFEDAVARIEQIDRDIALIVDRRPEGWRHELIRLRRKLADAVGDATLAMTKLKTCSPSQLHFLRESLSAFRHALALHQANHPASLIDKTNDYERSNDLVRQANRKFVADARSVDIQLHA